MELFSAQHFDGETLVVFASIIAIQIAQGRTASELETLVLFFDAIEENLSLIMAQRAKQEAPKQRCKETQTSQSASKDSSSAEASGGLLQEQFPDIFPRP